MRKIFSSLFISITLLIGAIPVAHAAISQADATYAQEAGKATQEFSTAIGNWGNTYQLAPDKINSSQYKSWMKKAVAADNEVKAALAKFSKIKVSAGYKKSDVTLRKFVKAYTSAITQYAPAIKKNDKKLVQKANDALMAATTLFTTWGTEFTQDTSALAKG